MSVRRAQAEISSSEFTYWWARDQMGGLHSRSEELFGELFTLIANVNRNPKRRSRPFTAADFFPPEPEPERPRTNEELMAMALAFQAKVNAGLKN